MKTPLFVFPISMLLPQKGKIVLQKFSLHRTLAYFKTPRLRLNLFPSTRIFSPRNKAAYFYHSLSIGILKSNEQSRGSEDPFTEEEIWLAIKALASHKSPRPDGSNAEFFKKIWNILNAI